MSKVNTENSDASIFDLQILDPEVIKLFTHGGLLRLTLGNEKSYIRVNVMRAFPLSDPDHYYGLMDGAGKDIGIITDPARLDEKMRCLCEDALEKRYFVPVVAKVLDLKEEFGTTTWRVSTDRGEKLYVVRHLRDNLIELTSQRVIITDTDGNRFEIPDVYELDAKSLSIVMRHM